MADINQLLKYVESCLDEFYDVESSNERKRDIEVQLRHFFDQNRSCDVFFQFMQNSTNQFVLMYSVSSLENIIKCKWHKFSVEEQDYCFQTIMHLLIGKYANIPHFLCNKLVKIMVSVSFNVLSFIKFNLISTVCDLLNMPETEVVGLVILRTASEEITSDKLEMSSLQKQELFKIWQNQIPNFFELIGSILRRIIDKPIDGNFKTPPPSPTNAIVKCEATIENLSMRPNNREITREILLTLQHLFTWIPLNFIKTSIINDIFYFTKTVTFSQAEEDINVLAISTINEIFYRKYFPSENNYIFHYVCLNVFQLISDITLSNDESTENLGFEFYEKLTELLSLLFKEQLERVSNSKVSLETFLCDFLKYTFIYKDYSIATNCLQIWNTIIKSSLIMTEYQNYLIHINLASKVLKSLESCCNETDYIIQKAFNDDFINNNNNNNNNDDDMYHLFVMQCEETLSLLGERFPESILCVQRKWGNDGLTYLTLHKTILNILHDSTQSRELLSFLKLFTTLTRFFGRLGNLYFNSKNLKTNSSDSLVSFTDMISHVISLTTYSNQSRFYHMSFNEELNNYIKAAFIEVHLELINFLQSWCKFLPVFDDNKEYYSENLLTISIENIMHLDHIPSNVINSVAHLFFAITNHFRPLLLLRNSSLLNTIRLCSTMIPQSPHKEAIILMHRAVCNILLQSWHTNHSNILETQLTMTNEFFSALTKSFCNLNETDNVSHVEKVVASSIPSLISIIDNYKFHNTNTKKLLFSGVQTSVQHSLKIFPLFANNIEITDHILSLFLTVLEVFRQQLTIEFVQHSAKVFLDVAMSEQRSSDLSGFNKLLQILQIIVAERSAIYKNFLPDILTLCLHHVRPIVFQKSTEYPDLTIAFYSLLHSILLHRWQYFYKSQVRMGFAPNSSENCPEVVEHMEELQIILEAFGQALLQPDINIFKISLSLLEDLNTKWKLYHKTFFKTQLLYQFLSVLFNMLIQKCHMLLKDDILLTIYNMAAVDFNKFFEGFLANFLESITDLNQDQRKELNTNLTFVNDVPTFVKQVEYFVNDCFYYQTINQRI